jgi:hypothetical protein
VGEGNLLAFADVFLVGELTVVFDADSKMGLTRLGTQVGSILTLSCRHGAHKQQEGKKSLHAAVESEAAGRRTGRLAASAIPTPPALSAGSRSSRIRLISLRHPQARKQKHNNDITNPRVS